jgi:hypothetical protein
MAFSVQYANSVAENYLDTDSYEISEGGVLVIRSKGQEKAFYYPPGSWVTLIADEDHNAGGPKGGSPPIPVAPKRLS